MKELIIKVLATIALCATVMFCASCSSCQRSFKSCNSNLNGGLYRIVNIYSLDGQLIATYEGKIDIDDNTNGSVMFELDGKRYVYYNAIVEVIEK